MHFWIDKRASHTQLYGRRRPGVFYSGRLSGLGRDKGIALGHHGNTLSSSSTNPVGLNPQQSSSSSSSNNNSNSTSNNSMVTPVHRFQTIESIRGEQLAGASGGSTSPSSNLGSRRSRAYSSSSNRLSSGHSSTTSRSRSHSRERRSSSLRRTPSHLSSDPVSTPIPDYGHHLTSASLTSTDISDGDPKWTRTKRIGLTLCFMAFILLCTVAAKFIIEGPSLIDSSRRHPASADASFFFITELVFVAFALVLFFSGVHCLRTRTNRFLLRAFQNQINQNIAQQASTRDGIPIDGMSGFLNNNNSGSDYFEHSSTQDDDENQDNYFLQQQSGSSGGGHHHHHHVLHSGNSLPGSCLYHSPTTFRSSHHRNSTHIISMVPDSLVIGGYGNFRRIDNMRHGHHHHDRRHLSSVQSQQPPPYHIALYLPLPSQDYDMEDGIKDQCNVKCSTSDAVEIRKNTDPILTNAEDGQSVTNPPAANNLNSSTTTNNNPSSNERDGAETPRPETPPPSYEVAFKKV